MSVQKAKGHVDRVILKRITQPAQNKWTKMDPAFQQASLVVSFFSLISSALEAKVRTSYAALSASQGLDDGGDTDSGSDADPAETKKTRMVKYGKRS